MLRSVSTSMWLVFTTMQNTYLYLVTRGNGDGGGGAEILVGGLLVKASQGVRKFSTEREREREREREKRNLIVSKS
jgi:hypothetical protein